ncbi:MAG: hypothetical protein M0P49_02075 [Bacilli bacterium]|nr:hypothetical protein [Bacilli bacterium]
MQIILKISGIIVIIGSIILMWDITVWLMRPIKEIWESSLNSTFNIYSILKLIGRFIVSIIAVILIIFVLLLGFQLISKY